MRRKNVFLGIALLVIGIVSIVFSLIPIPFRTRESYSVPHSSIINSGTFTVPAGDSSLGYLPENLVSGDTVHIYFRVVEGGNLDIDFEIQDANNHFKWLFDEEYYPTVSLSRISFYDDDFTIPYDETWNLIWDNTFSFPNIYAVILSIQY